MSELQPELQRHHRAKLPVIASFGRVSAGRSTIDGLDRLLGAGKVGTGGHPQGARLWRLDANWILRADGFEWAKDTDSYVLDDLMVKRDSSTAGLPRANVRALRGRGLFDYRSLGLDQAHERRRLGQAIAAQAEYTGHVFRVKQRGFAPAASLSFTTWILVLGFDDHGKLAYASVTCEGS